jgi:hypothetical protein
MWKRVLAVIIGMVVGGAVVGLVETLGHLIFPIDESLTSTPQGIKAYLETAPFGALAFLPLAWFFGAFSGAFVSTLIQPERKGIAIIIVISILLIGTTFNFIFIPHPTWVLTAGVLVHPLAGALAIFITKAKVTKD